jgi:hypothetical protein
MMVGDILYIEGLSKRQLIELIKKLNKQVQKLEKKLDQYLKLNIKLQEQLKIKYIVKHGKI